MTAEVSTKSETTPKKRHRIELIDLIKALTIFLVVWGHVAGNSDAPLYRKIIYSFHMPLFFALAGMSMKIRTIAGFREWGAYLKRNFLSLMVPYFIWGLIYSQTTYDNIINLLYGSWEAVNEMNTLTALWFLPCLFVARILVQIIINLVERYIIVRKEIGYFAFAVILMVIGLLIPHGNGWFWCFDAAVVAAGFILTGLVVKKGILMLAQQRAIIISSILIISLILFVGAILLWPDSLILMLMCRGIYGNIFWLFYYIILGSLIVITLAMLLARISREGPHPFSVRAFTYIGTHTMGIYLLHKPILQNLLAPAVSFLLPNVNAVLTSCISALLMVLISCLLCRVIEIFIPQLLGQFPRE